VPAQLILTDMAVRVYCKYFLSYNAMSIMPFSNSRVLCDSLRYEIVVQYILAL